jgi:hypothetical protein
MSLDWESIDPDWRAWSKHGLVGGDMGCNLFATG